MQKKNIADFVTFGQDCRSTILFSLLVSKRCFSAGLKISFATGLLKALCMS